MRKAIELDEFIWSQVAMEMERERMDAVRRGWWVVMDGVGEGRAGGREVDVAG